MNQNRCFLLDHCFCPVNLSSDEHNLSWKTWESIHFCAACYHDSKYTSTKTNVDIASCDIGITHWQMMEADLLGKLDVGARIAKKSTAQIQRLHKKHPRSQKKQIMIIMKIVIYKNPLLLDASCFFYTPCFFPMFLPMSAHSVEPRSYMAEIQRLRCLWRILHMTGLKSRRGWCQVRIVGFHQRDNQGEICWCKIPQDAISKKGGYTYT